MDNLVVVHTEHALNLLGDQLLQVLHLVLQVSGLSLTHLQLLVSLLQLGLEVVDVALGSGQLILSVLQSGAGVIEVIGLEVTAAISPHQLFIQLPDVRLKAGVLLMELSVGLLDVLDGAVLGIHLIGALLWVEAQVSAHHCDVLKQGAHMLGVACCERPTHMVGQKLGSPTAATHSLHIALPSF
jgi:hypothetical protein